MMSNPNMSLAEFASRFGFELQPHQKLLIEAIEHGEPLHRTLSDGRVKNTVTGYVEEPASMPSSEYTGDGS